MSVATMNAFTLLDDEGTMDATELAAKIPAAPKEAPKKVASEGASRAGAPAPSRGNRANGGGADRTRGGRGGPGASYGNVDLAPEEERRGGRNSKPRGMRHGTGDRARKREYDRHDGTGRGHEVEKRGGGGKGNWGTETDELATAESIEKITLAEGEEAGENAPQEEEEPQLTLEEYEAQMAEKRAILNAQKESAFKADASQFEGMKTFEKKEEDLGLELVKNAKTIGSNKAGINKQRKEREVVVDVGFRVVSESERKDRARGNRSGRGGNRSGNRGGNTAGRSGGRPRGGRGGQINVDDTSAFPSLG